jgi:NADH-quinone oxidoreductase subunit N
MSNSLQLVSPVLVLSAGSILVLLMGLWIQNHKAILTAAIGSLLVAGALFVSLLSKPAQSAFGGMFVHDPFGSFFSIFAVVVTILSVIVSAKSAEIKSDRRSEYYSILLALSTGLVFMSVSTHLLMIYLAVETVSILSYTLAGFHRERNSSIEASMKYVVFGSAASALMVYGMSFLYGITGGLELQQIREYFATTPVEQVPTMMWVATLLVFAGIGYKVSAAPMHMWTPDVYEGSPTPVSAFLSVAPKAAGFALLLRFFITAFTLPLEGSEAAITSQTSSSIAFHMIGPFNWPKFLMLSSIFTMFMGNLAALGQTSVKRILAYSSIAHAGYILMGATTQNEAGIAAIAFYMVIYCLMNIGAFWVASKVDDTFGGDHLRHFRGLVYRKPFYAVVMAIFLFSLVGLPPFAGFIGKFYLFSAVIVREMYGFAIIAAINSVISLYYYVKIIKAMFLEAPEVKMAEGPSAFDSKTSMAFLTLLAVPNIVLGLYWEPVIKAAQQAVEIFIR